MQFLQCKGHFTNIRPSNDFIEWIVSDIFLQIPTLAQIHQNEQMGEILQAVIALQYEGMFDFS